jgi:hypothetical protein
LFHIPKIRLNFLESDLLKAIPLPVDRLPVAQAAPLYNGEYGDRPEYFQAQPPQVMVSLVEFD